MLLEVSISKSIILVIGILLVVTLLLVLMLLFVKEKLSPSGPWIRTPSGGSGKSLTASYEGVSI